MIDHNHVLDSKSVNLSDLNLVDLRSHARVSHPRARRRELYEPQAVDAGLFF